MMPTVKVVQETERNAPELYEKLKKYCDEKLILKELGNLRPNVEWNDAERMGRFEEKGVKGTIAVTLGSPSTITVTMDLPFFMTPFKGIFHQSIQNHLAKFA